MGSAKGIGADRSGELKLRGLTRKEVRGVNLTGLFGAAAAAADVCLACAAVEAAAEAKMGGRGGAKDVDVDDAELVVAGATIGNEDDKPVAVPVKVVFAFVVDDDGKLNMLPVLLPAVVPERPAAGRGAKKDVMDDWPVEGCCDCCWAPNNELPEDVEPKRGVVAEGRAEGRVRENGAAVPVPVAGVPAEPKPVPVVPAPVPNPAPVDVPLLLPNKPVPKPPEVAGLGANALVAVAVEGCPKEKPVPDAVGAGWLPPKPVDPEPNKDVPD